MAKKSNGKQLIDCPNCGGSGFQNGIRICKKCQGTGHLEVKKSRQMRPPRGGT